MIVIRTLAGPDVGNGWGMEGKLSGRSETCHARGTEGRAAGWLAVDFPAASLRNRAGCHVWHAPCVTIPS